MLELAARRRQYSPRRRQNDFPYQARVLLKKERFNPFLNSPLIIDQKKKNALNSI